MITFSQRCIIAIYNN